MIILFLWDEFLFKYRTYFSLDKNLHLFCTKQKCVKFTWIDPEYREFMTEVLAKLEPFHFYKKEHLLEEFDDVNQIFFVEQGKIVIGYDINKTKKYCL